MKTLCQLDGDSICTQCGSLRDPNAKTNCPAKFGGQPRPPRVKQPQLGDLTQLFFESVGITEERFKELKGKLRLDSKTCGCNYRKELINGIGEMLGFDAAFGKFLEWRRGEVKRAPRPTTNN